MSGPETRLLDLLTLAQDESSDKRRQLLREIADLYLEAPADYNAAEAAHFGDIMGRIARDVEMDMRRSLAERLANLPNAPHALVTQLANDEIAVAAPLLARSLVLKDDDLVAIAQQRSQDHLRVVARRPTVSAVVSNALVEHGDENVLEALVLNQGATIARETMETVVQRASAIERLHRPVLERTDLPPDLMNEMFFAVSTSLKEFILSRTADMDPDVLEKMLADAERQTARRVRIAQRAPSSAEQFINDKQAKRQLNEQLLVALLRARQMPEFVVGFARLAEIDLATAKRLVADEGAEGLAIACRAAGFEKATFSTIVLLANPAKTRTVQETNALFALYDRVKLDAAQRVMRFWKVRREALKPEAPAPRAATG